MTQASPLQPETRPPSAQHVRPGCECRILQAPIDDIADLLEAGDVPVLRIEAGDTDKLTLRAQPSNGEQKYVVLTSMIPNFLGLSIYHTLSTCQLLRLALPLGRLQSECSEPLSFWFSDLCLLETEPSRTSRLGEIYGKAYAILVWDPDFLRLTASGALQDLRTYLPHLYRQQPLLAVSRRILLMAGGSFIDVQAVLAKSRNSVRIGHRQSLSSNSLSRSTSMRSKPDSTGTRSS